MALHERSTPLTDQSLDYLRDLYKVYLPKEKRLAVDKMNKKQILAGFLKQGVGIHGRVDSFEVRGVVVEDDGLNFV